MVQGGAVVTGNPNPAIIAARFGRRAPAIPVPQRPQVQPAGWNDAISLPMQEHFYLDTGIFHSLASSIKVVGLSLVTLLKGHEENEAISSEVRTQKRGTTLADMAPMLLPAMTKVARLPCDIAQDLDEIESIRNELLADAQQRHPEVEHDLSTRMSHGGEAELIHLAQNHDPRAVLVCNDTGASAVGAVRGLASIHFLHVLRAAVRAGTVTVDESLEAAKEGLSESGLEGRERRRTECEEWLSG